MYVIHAAICCSVPDWQATFPNAAHDSETQTLSVLGLLHPLGFQSHLQNRKKVGKKADLLPSHLD